MPATNQATDKFLSTFSSFRPSRNLGDTDLKVSPFGFGTYRTLVSVDSHKTALEQAITGGVNLIDTSSNYSNGSAEELIGKVLQERFIQGLNSREQMVVVSKVGYVQGSSLDEAKARKSKGNGFKDMVEFHPQAWHCIHPEFIRYTLEKSLQRLGLESLDILLLHNPEYFFKESADHSEYYRRIKTAFETMETLVSEGKISFYGISSNTFPDSEASGSFTSLSQCLALANEIKKDHHFRVVQLPANLIEDSAFIEKNNNGQSVISYAQQNRFGLLTNRPFNAFRQDRLVRLVSFAQHDEALVKGRLHSELQDLIAHERSFEQFAPPPQEITWGINLRDHLQEIEDIIEWRDILNQQVLPVYNRATEKLPPSPEITAWKSQHRKKLFHFLSTLTQNFENQSAIISERIKTKILNACSKANKNRTLSQLALQIYLSSPAVSSVLVGMRNPTYVGDVLDTPLDLDLNENELQSVFKQVQ